MKERKGGGDGPCMPPADRPGVPLIRYDSSGWRLPLVVRCSLWKKLHFAFSPNAILAGTRSVQLVTASPMKPEHPIFGKSVLNDRTLRVVRRAVFILDRYGNNYE